MAICSWNRLIKLLTLMMVFGVARRDAARAEEPDPMPNASPMPNLELATMGGNQFWSDELFFHDWRIQRHAVSGHCRLLDKDNVRQAWGTFGACQARLDEIREERHLAPMQGKVILVLHGLFRTRNSMERLANQLREGDEYTVLNVTYATTRRDVAAHAASLANIVAGLGEVEELNFVGHSMGNIVIRHFLADLRAARAAAGASTPIDPRIKRVVMIAPPNRGSEFSAALSENLILSAPFKVVAGSAALELGVRWKELEPRLAIPDCEFAIIAGGRNNDRGYNPWLKGDNDAVVTVAGTRLPGAADFRVLPLPHTLIMVNPKVRGMVANFIRHGYLTNESERQPLLAESSAAAH